MIKFYSTRLSDHTGQARKKLRLLFSLACLFLSTTLFAQQTIRGRVTCDDGALNDVTVTVKGTNNSTTTNARGEFSVRAKPGDVLVFTSVGFAPREIPVNNQGTLAVKMLISGEVMSDVVVVGYGTMRKKDLTGSIIQVRPDKIANENPKTVQDILRGTPGVSVGFDPSAKGGGSMQIRGQRSVYTDNGHNNPLLILDGMIFYGELSEINPDDISQIDILKDASAAAVYGARSANGVIIITTKKGQKGKPKINFTSNWGFATMGANRKVFGPEGFLQYRQDWYTAASYGTNTTTGAYEPYRTGTSNGKPGYYEKPTPEVLDKYGITINQWKAYTVNTAGASDDEIWARRLLMQDVTLANYLAGKTFDWYDHSFQTGINQDYNISVSGANDRMNYYMSAGYLSNQGVAIGNNYKAIRSNIKVEGRITNWLDIGANINFQDRTDGDLAVDWGTQILTNSPFANYADSTGKPVVHPMGDLTNNKGYNYDFNRQYLDLNKGYMILNSIFTTKVKLPFNINYTFNFSPRYQFFHDRYFESSEHPDWPALNHGVNREQSERFDWSLNSTINWDHTFAKKHRVNVTLVQEAEKRQYWQDRIEARNILPSDALGYHETYYGDQSRSTFNSDDSKETADGMLARVFYSFDERYMVTASVRRDGYSAFGSTNHPRGTFFSTAVAWTFTNESFFKWKPMSMGKLRLSWGQNGNRSLGDPYLALANLGAGAGATQGYLDANGNYIQYRYLSVSRLANPYLRWERTTAKNAGLDVGFLDNRITGTFDYYLMPTTDMIMNETLPGFSGVSNITTNLGEVENKGFEITLNSQNIKRKNFTWNTTLGFSKYKNTIKHLYYVYQDVVDDNGNVVGAKEVDDVANGWFIGHPISSIWNYRVTGIWQANEAAEAANYGQRPGDPKVANNYTADDIKNSNGTTTPVYNDKDKEFLGQTAPPIMWSLRNDFTYKSLTFSFNIYSYWGHKTLSGNYLNQDNGTSQVTNNANSYAKSYWTLDNPNNVYARLDAKGPAGVTSPGRLFDRSFIRLDNISIGYTLPARLTRKCELDKVKIFGSIRNVAVWKKDKNWQYGDIETYDPNQAAISGLAPRIFSVGLNLNF